MKAQKFSCLSGSVGSAAAMFLFSNALLVSGIAAQSAPAASVVSLPNGATAVPFVVAPSFALSGSPSHVAMGDLNEDGKPDLVTTDAVSGKVTVFLGMGEGKFSTGVEYAIGFHPSAVIVADLDGDGHLEVIVGDESKDTISVLSSAGSGALQLRQSLAAGINPAYLSVGDFDGDGKKDLAVASGSAASLTILLNDGKGNLQKGAVSALAKVPTSLVSSDFNNDGHTDLALANTDGSVSILLGTGSGRFQAVHDISVGSGSLSSIVAGDFNRDGNVDLAVTQSAVKTLSVLLGKGNGDFASPAGYAVGNNPVSSLVADLDGDGVADLVVVNQGSNTYSVLGGNGDGTFKTSLDYVVGNGPLAALAGQFEAEGHVDLAVLNPSSPSVSVPLGNGDGTFKAARSYVTGIEPRALVSADLNGDKLPDLVVTNYCGSETTCSKGGSVTVFLANTDGSYKLANTYAAGAGPVSVALADVNGDKLPDIVELNRGDKTISVLLAKGDGSFEQPYTFATTDSPLAVAVGDFNQDGRIDLAVLGDCGTAACRQQGRVEVFTGRGDGGFTGGALYPTGYSSTSMAIADLNQDHNLDIVVSNRCGADASCKSIGTATVLLGSAAGKFTASKAIALGSSPSSIALGDMSGRGIPDLLVSSSSDNSLAILRGNGDGSFQAPAAYKVGNTPDAVAVADFNGDGKLDVAVANAQDSTVSVLYGKGDGTLNSSFVLPVGTGPAAMAVVAATKSSPASLVTANANTGAVPPGTDVTVLANIRPEVASVTPTISVALTTGASSDPYGTTLVFTATVTGTANETQPTGTVTFNDASQSGTPALICMGTGDGTLTQNDTTNSTATCTISTLTIGTHQITATYNPATTEPTYLIAGPSSELEQIVTKVTPNVTVALTSGSSSSVFGAALTFTATVPGTNGLALPTGTISFLDGTTALTCSNTVTLTPGTTSSTATCTISSLAPGSHSITAAYTPATTDTNYNGDTSTSVTQTVGKATPTVTISSSAPTSSNVNDKVSFTATVTSSASPAPTGKVSFTLNTVAIASCQSLTLVSGSVTCPNLNTLVAPSDTIGVSYAGDNNYGTATATPLTQTVNPLTATLGLAASAAPYSVGSPVTFTVSIKNIALTPIAPSGTVNVTVNGVAPSSCTSLTISSGTATCQTQFSIAQSYVVQAVYGGTDPNFTLASSTPPLALQVGKATTSGISLTSSVNPSSVNQQVAFVLTVTPPSGSTSPITPTGTATFSQGATTLCNTVPLAAGSATCNYTFTAPSTGESITAVYSGDTNYGSGSPTPVNQVVKASGTSTSLAGTPTPSTVNQQVSFTATVTPTFSGTVAPSGSVTFNSVAGGNSTAICSNVTLTGGAASCNYTYTSAASNSVTATFNSSNGNFSTSTSSAYAQTVGASGTSVSLSSSAPTGSTVNQQVTFSATVTASSSGNTLPQGTVTYTDTFTNTTLCAAPLSSGMAQACPATLLVAGTHTIVATFKPSDSNFQAASSTPLNQIVNAGTTVLALTSSANPSVVDQSVTFTATVTPSPAGATAPTGKVTFSYLQNGSAVILCSSPQTLKTNGTAVCSAPLTAASSYTVTASYASGDSNFTGSTSTPVTQAVNATSTTVTVSTPSPSPSYVNQLVSFTAVVAPVGVSDSGLTLPTGTVVFSDSVAGTLCTSTLAADGTVPACKAALGTAGAHSITAVYSGDTNFSTSTSASAFSQTVNKAATTIVVVSSSLSSVVTEAVTYTATVTPAASGTAPTGAITFSLTQGTNSFPCAATGALPANGTAPYTATCTISYPSTVSGSVTVTASYAGDSNFAGSTSSAITQTVQNFSSSVTPGAITLTQGSLSTPNTNLADPFSPTPIGLTSTALDGFTDPVAVTSCVVSLDSSGNAIPGLSCATVSSPTTNSGVVVVTATSSTPIGAYTVLITVADARVTTLFHVVNLTVNVINLATQASTPIVGSTTATFNLAAPLPSGSALSYGNVSIVNTDGTYTIIPITEVGIQISAITSVSPTSYSFTITAGTAATAQLKPSSNVIAALAIGAPLLFALSLLPGARKRRRSWMRYLGVAILALAAMQGIGCSSGGFTRSSAKVAEVGSYVIQIENTQNGTTSTVAVVPLLIEQ